MPPTARTAPPRQVMIATESFATQDEHGTDVIVVAGRTRVPGDSWLVDRFPQHFESVEADLQYAGVEAATDVPGESRVRSARARTGREE